jgi:hypothetical protein
MSSNTGPNPVASGKESFIAADVRMWPRTVFDLKEGRELAVKKWDDGTLTKHRVAIAARENLR